MTINTQIPKGAIEDAVLAVLNANKTIVAEGSFNITTVLRGNNFASITKTSTGIFDIVFDNEVSLPYGVQGCYFKSSSSTSGIPIISSYSKTGFTLQTRQANNGVLFDPDRIELTVYGDLD